MNSSRHLQLVQTQQLTRSDLPTMTAVQLGDLVTRWQETAKRNEAELRDNLKTLAGIDADFGPGAPHPIPVCPGCGWTSTDEDQNDFQAEGPGTKHPLGVHIHFVGCGHRWAVTDVPVWPGTREPQG